MLAVYLLSFTACVSRAAPVADASSLSSQTTGSPLPHSSIQVSFTSPILKSSSPPCLDTPSVPVASPAYAGEAVFVYPESSSLRTVSFEEPQSQSLSKPLVMSYYPDWTASDFPPEKIDYTHFDWMDFAFALPDQYGNLTWDDPETAPALLSRLCDSAHAQNTKVKLSIGGWTGSQYFSSVLATDDNRRLFVGNIVALYDEFQLDGIDIDWEYPGHDGEKGNEISNSDSANFLEFLKLLRLTLPEGAVITAATQPTPFVGENGRPLHDVTEFANVLDWILVMVYDVWSSSVNPGPNAPFFDACHNSTQKEASAVGAYNAWTNAGFPASQIVLGLPSYGYVSRSNATQLRTRFNPRQESNVTAVISDEGKSEGQIQFRSLVSQNALVANTSDQQTTFVAGEGWFRQWDDCSSTPYLCCPSLGQVVSYDDTESLALKAAWVEKMGLRGVNMWDVHGDTDQCDLAKAIRVALGY